MKLYIHGVVQGVGFRPTVYRVAMGLDLRGYVRNNGSNVEVCIDGDQGEFLSRLREALPPMASIDRVEEVDEPCPPEYASFEIVQSQRGERDSPLPPDTALCDDCLRELMDLSDRRHRYPFTNCTNCGARFSVISDLPYDRDRTAMEPFKLCGECTKEYGDPMDRRFHAQTISCPDDGPRYALYDSGGGIVESPNPITDFAREIDAGRIGVVKTWGGMHICCRLDRVAELREWYGRESKPFAVMVRDLDAAGELAHVDEDAERLLTSPVRPIVLLRKGDAPHVELVSPGLGNVGIYLPYTPVQYLLFEGLEADALVMTSANLPGEPMVTENDHAFALGADAYLLHNRAIVNRIDDSLVIPYLGSQLMIRRSRGYVPVPLEVPFKSSTAGCGAERNVNFTLASGGRAYMSQYIGNASKYGVMGFLEGAAGHLTSILGVERLDAVGIDLHPGYTTRRFGEELASRHGIEPVEVQHHWAHALALMADVGCYDPMVVLALDGTGYGTDGAVWGGEVLLSRTDGFDRVGSLSYLPLPGGDAAIKSPERFVFAIEHMLGRESRFVEGREAEVLGKAMARAPLTSSSGRVLDALAYVLAACKKRTYDGEPAMRLEPLLGRGRPSLDFELRTEEVDGRRVVDTLHLFRQLYEMLDDGEGSKGDLARSFVSTMVRGLVDIAIDIANKEGLGSIGLSGGVTYNLPLSEMVRKGVESAGLGFVRHSRVPNGDGCISLGQALAAGFAQSL